MELIPILSLIVLVATISTFILAIGAYVLYKLRERQGRGVTALVPQTVQAELFAPQVVQAGRPETTTNKKAATTGQKQIQRIEKLQQGPVKEQKPGGRAAYAQEKAYQPSEPMPAQQTGGAKSQESQVAPSESQAPAEKTTTSTDKKFMKYTSEGYIPVSKTTKTGDSLRWR